MSSLAVVIFFYLLFYFLFFYFRTIFISSLNYYAMNTTSRATPFTENNLFALCTEVFVERFSFHYARSNLKVKFHYKDETVSEILNRHEFVVIIGNYIFSRIDRGFADSLDSQSDLGRLYIRLIKGHLFESEEIIVANARFAEYNFFPYKNSSYRSRSRKVIEEYS